MKIRKYTAQNAQEAIAKVKLELGGDAFIINTRKVRQKGILGIMKKPLVEVVAAIDEQAQAKSRRVAGQIREHNEKSVAAGVSNDVFAQFQSQLKAGRENGAEALAIQRDASAAPAVTREAGAAPAVNPGAELSAELAAAPIAQPAARLDARREAGAAPAAQRGAIGAAAREAYAKRGPEPRAAEAVGGEGGQAEGGRSEDLGAKIANIESMLSKVYREVAISSKVAGGGDERQAPLTNMLRLFYNNLVKNEVEPEFSLDIIERVNDALREGENASDAASALYKEITAALGKPEIINVRRDKKPTVAIFVGPTGVGKTTTIAKIAADSALNRNMNVAMITADTYRIAAVQQIKTYAEILGIPLAVIYSPGELKQCVAEFADKDLILIDTAGRSHRNRAQFDELRELVREADADEVFLVLSSTTSVKNGREIIRNYNFLNEFKLIFTKADETPVFGAMLNARLLTGKCLSYVTVGQNVPDDIEVASVDRIARNLIGSVAE